MSDEPVLPPTQPPSVLDREGRTASSLLSIVVAQASFVVAIMYFLGAVYLVAFYGYFRLDAFSLGFGFAEIAMQSLNVATAPVAFVCVLALLVIRQLAAAHAVRVAQPDTDEGDRRPVVGTLEGALRILTRVHLLVVASGLALLLMWSSLGSFKWTAPLLLGVGILLGQSTWRRRFDAQRDTARGAATVAFRTWSQGVPVFAAGLLAMWALSLATGELGKQEARQSAANLVRRPAVVLLSTDRLSLAGPGLEVTDLGAENRFRYRYTGLRRLIERNSRYYLVPLGWTHQTGPTYVIKDGGHLRIEIYPGTRE